MSETYPSKDALELVEIRKHLRFSQAKFAQLLGLGFATYKNYEYRDVPPEVMKKARSMRGDGMVELTGQTGTIQKLGAIGANLHGPGYQGDDDEMIVPIAFARPDYKGVPVPSGEYSMLPFIQPGDTLVFKGGSKLHMFVAARLQGETLPVCKKLTTEAGRAVLRSMNPDYADIPADGHEIVGYLVGIIPADSPLIIGPYDEGLNDITIKTLLNGRLF